MHLHGIHSPFIYALQRQCLLEPCEDALKERLVRFRESVKKNPQKLQITDHGAGSKYLDNHSRSTDAILKHNCTPPRRAELLTQLAQYLHAKKVLELGTSLGVGTAALALSAEKVTTVEGSPAIHQYASQRFVDQKLLNINAIRDTFQDFLKGTKDNKPEGFYDLIFIDGHHDGDATARYFELLLPYCHEHTLLIIDDIYWSTSMTRAWKKLQKHPRVTASVDTFQWGLLFLRTEQRQQSFYIKV